MCKCIHLQHSCTPPRTEQLQARAHTSVCQVAARSGRCLLASAANAAGWCHGCVHVRVCVCSPPGCVSSSVLSLQTDEATVSSASLHGSSSASCWLPLTPVSRQPKMAADAKISRLQSTRAAGTHARTHARVDVYTPSSHLLSHILSLSFQLQDSWEEGGG